MNEDKQAILDALLPALNLTRDGRKITKLVLIGETVFICFGDYSMTVNASGDSGGRLSMMLSGNFYKE